MTATREATKETGRETTIATQPEEGPKAREETKREAAPEAEPKALARQASKVVDDVRELGDIARSAATETLSTGKEQLEDYEEKIVTYVKRYPVKSVLVAAGTGLLTGLFLRRG